MPLVHGKSKKAFEHNLKAEIHAGKPMAQSLAIAYATKRRAGKKMARGGAVGANSQAGVDAEEIGINTQALGHKRGTSHAGAMIERGGGKDGNFFNKEAKSYHKEVLSEAKHMPKPTSGKSGFAEGGCVDEDMEDMGDADMIARIMHKRKEYSKGGVVANDTGEGEEADELPNEFDDLVLDDHLMDESGPGNEHGDTEQEARDSDVVSKIMASRKKKDRMPRPA